jgi:aminocarboxymuconate-semialdehyde decarboxylase
VEPSSIDAGLAQFYFDSVTHDPEILRQLVDWVGPDRVVLGSDYPFDMGVADPIALVRDAEFPADVEAAILGRNANRLTANGTG